MMGRAGRPQFDDSGVACVFVHEPKKNFYKKFLHEPFPVESSLHEQLPNHINAEIAAQTILSLEDCVEYLTWTYFFRRLIMNPSYYNVSDISEDGIQRHLVQLCRDILGELAQNKCIEVDGDAVSSTLLGSVASNYYIDSKTVCAFNSFLTEDSSKYDLKDVLWTLCEAIEFSELPVRHNEDVLNAALAAKLPWSKDRMDYDSPNLKAYLLLQAHFFCIPLPISDYINDTKTVLDNVPRVLNALMDIAIEDRKLCLVKTLLTLSQLVIQVRANAWIYYTPTVCVSDFA